MTTSDRFGFLPIKRAIEFDGGRLEPIEDYDERVAEVEARVHADGVVFPPLMSSQSVFPARRPGATSTRPAPLYRLPASHALTVTAPLHTSDFRQNDGGFLIHFVGHMFCYRLQFHDWWHDTIVPMHGRLWSYLPEESERSLFSTAYQSWKTWPERERVRFTSLLYMHIRSFSYEWDWERFAIRYMIFDGCYRTALALGRVTKVRFHRDRLEVMLSAHQLAADAGRIAEIVALRNDLFHEVLWDRNSPGTGSRAGFVHADNLWRINDRLLFALVGYRGSYLSFPWWNIGRSLI